MYRRSAVKSKCGQVCCVPCIWSAVCVESHCAGLGAYLHQASRTQKNTCKSGSPVCCVPTSVATRTALVPVLVLVPMMVLVLVPGLEVMANEVETAARTRDLRSRSFS